jgi:plastocyanin
MDFRTKERSSMNPTRISMMVVLTIACTPAAPSQSPVTTAAAPAAALNIPPPTAGHGNIIGTVATNPWHDIKGGGVVYLEDGPKDVVASGTLDNHDMTFVPNIVVITAGGSVIFTNTDPIVHNVFSPDNEKWDLGQIPQNGSTTKRFDTPGTYAVLCNLHQNMRAYLVVSPSSYFARTESDGTFVIKNVPLGSYHVTAWVPRLKPASQPITVDDSEATINFKLER